MGLEKRRGAGGEQVVDVTPSPHPWNDPDVEDGQEAGRLCRHHQADEIFIRRIRKPPPGGIVLYPSRIIEELACGLLRSEPFALALDLTVECAFGDYSHRLDERILADLIQGTKRQSPGNGGRLSSAPLEASGLSAKVEPHVLQQLGPLLGMVLELGTHRWIIYDVLDLLCPKSTRLFEHVSEEARAYAQVVPIPGDIEEHEGEGLLHARQRPEGDTPERLYSSFGDEAPLEAHRACGEHALQVALDSSTVVWGSGGLD